MISIYSILLITWIAVVIPAFVFGSVPSGVWLAKLFGLPDPRYIGSGNIGATNMLRSGNKKIALLTLALDMGKGVLAVMLPVILFGSPLFASSAVLFAALGHMYSPWLKFKGGKGMATILGGTLALSWPVGMAALLVWLIVVFTTRYVSLGSIAALATIPLVTLLRVDISSATTLAIACAFGIWKHRGNIKRWRDGFEPKINFARGTNDER